jgi:hypothetical protein
MIPNVKDRSLTTSGVSESQQFGISLKDSAHLMVILRDTLYSDKILAVLREYGANAWDAHRMVGKMDLPIKVTLPTTFEPTLSIRDFGPGISHEDIFQVYTQYGASTKRDSDTAVGMLGIGSKSGFAYSDSFTVTSWNGGKKRIYTAVLDKTDEGTMNLLYEEDCGEETGILIQIPVRPSDIEEFTSKARVLFKHFRPQPEINTTLENPATERTELKHGYICSNDSLRVEEQGWTAIMGCVPYRINLNQVRGLIGEHIHKVSGALYFDIGAVQINASREELKYSDSTKKAIVEKFNDLVDEFVLHTLTEIENSEGMGWTKRLRAQVFHKLRIPVPPGLKSIAESVVHAEEELKTFYFRIPTFEMRRVGKSYNKRANVLVEAEGSRFLVKDDTKIVLVDDRRRLAGFQGLNERSHLVRKRDEKVSWDEVEREMEVMIRKLDIEGIPIIRLSTLTWVPKLSGAKTFNPKHLQRVFVYNGRSDDSKPSNSWDSVEHEPGPDDVWVVLESFRPVFADFARMYREDLRLAQAFGFQMPKIIGYKHTEKKPVDREKLLGLPYHQWSIKKAKELCTEEFHRHINNAHWAGAQHWGIDKFGAEIIKALGEDHLISQFLRNHLRAKKEMKKVPKQIETAFGVLEERLFKRKHIDDDTPEERLLEIDKMRRDLRRRYPLLAERDPVDTILNHQFKDWLEYVQLKDKSREEQEHAARSDLHPYQRFIDHCLGGPSGDGPQGSAELRAPGGRASA